MTNLSRPPSGDRLHPNIQRWIYEQQWTELREVQARAINAIGLTESDVILAAATASGKTEAAFLPILSSITDVSVPSFQVMYVGPVRALINDQFLRLEPLCEKLKIPVVKWHGEVQDSMRRQARERPAGVLLITPESLEALFVRRPEVLLRMFGSLRFIVIDELHTFLSTERGIQLASLLKRLEKQLAIQPRRVGLDGVKLAELDHNLERSKYDALIPRKLLQQSAAKDRLNAAAIPGVAESLRREIETA
ncbi:MAG: DEAD/DEAH box helicase [Pseudorhodoplanes sp.]|nr:DEAD/DEAH box helicase [Pseudorhodoplanes sp.]